MVVQLVFAAAAPAATFAVFPCCRQIHQLNSGWSEARKASYVRHAVREYTIHKALHHRNIVSLTDIFEVGAIAPVRVSMSGRGCSV